MNSFSLPSIISTQPESIRLFILGNNQRVRFNRLSQDDNWLSAGNSWSGLDGWPNLQETVIDIFPIGTPVSVSSPGMGILDLFGIRGSGSLYHLRYRKNLAEGFERIRWRSIGTDFPVGAPISTVNRQEGLIEIFIVKTNGRVYSNNRTLERGWSAIWNNLGGSFPTGAPVTVISRNEGSLDLFAISNRGKVQWRRIHPVYDDNGRLFSFNPLGLTSDWTSLPGAFTPGAYIKAIASSASRMELFIVGPDEKVYHNWWEEGAGWQSGTDEGQQFPYFSAGSRRSWVEIGGAFPDGCPVQAISKNPSHIDLFATATDGMVYTRSKTDQSDWTPEWRPLFGKKFVMGAPVSGISRLPGVIDLFVQARDETIYSTQMAADGQWRDWQSLGAPYRDERMFGMAELHTHPAAHLGIGVNENGVEGVFWGLPGGSISSDTIARDLGACNGDIHIEGIEILNLAKYRARKLIISQINGIVGFSHGPNGWPTLEHWPSALSILHQQMHITWIHRAYLGGVRLMMASVTDNQVISRLWNDNLSHEPDAEFDFRSARRQLTFIRNLADANASWMSIVTTPREARQAISENRLAIILSLEMDTLTMTQIEELHDQYGVRQIIPIHLVNNEFGGVAAYASLFNTSNNFLNGKFIEVECDNDLSFRFKRMETNYIEISHSDILFNGLGFPKIVPDEEFRWLGYERSPDEFNVHSCCHPRNGHKNALGVSKSRLIRLMQKGMMIDLAHMSEKSQNETLAIAKILRYPLMNSHTGLREDENGGGSERGMKKNIARSMAMLGGVLGLGTAGGHDFPDAFTIYSHDGTDQVRLTKDLNEWSLQINVENNHRGAARYLRLIIETPAYRGSALLNLGIGGLGEYNASGDDLKQDSLVYANIRFANGIHSDFRTDLNFGSTWESGSTYKPLILLPIAVTPRDIESITIQLVPWDHLDYSDQWDFILRKVELIFDNPIGNWAWGYRDSLDHMDHYGVTIGSDMNGFESQLPFASVPEVAAQFSVANILAPEAIRNRFPILGRHTAGQRTFNFNTDGLAHFGMIPDFVECLKNIFTINDTRQPGVEITQIFQTAEATIQMWERAIAASRRITNALIDQINEEETSDGRLNFMIKTGGDNLKGRNDNAHAVVGLKNGRRVNVFLNQGHEWHEGSVNIAHADLPPGTRPNDISFIGIKTTLGGGGFGDNWNMDQIILEYAGRNRNQILLRQENQPLKRFTGNDHYWTSFVYTYGDEVNASRITRLVLSLETGENRLRGDNHNAKIIIQCTQNRVLEHPLNGFAQWPENSVRYVTIDLPPGISQRTIIGMQIIYSVGSIIELSLPRDIGNSGRLILNIYFADGRIFETGAIGFFDSGFVGLPPGYNFNDIERIEIQNYQGTGQVNYRYLDSQGHIWDIKRIVVSWQGSGKFGRIFQIEGTPGIRITPGTNTFRIPLDFSRELRLYDGNVELSPLSILIESLNPANEAQNFTEPPFKALISIRGSNDRYWCAENGGGGIVNVNREQVSIWETFSFEYQGSNFVSIKAVNGRYVSADNGGGAQVFADRSNISHNEVFEIIYLGFYQFAFRTHNGQYLRANPDGTLWATNLTIGGDEIFTVQTLKTDETYISVNQLYLWVSIGLLNPFQHPAVVAELLANAVSGDQPENKFTIIRYNNNNVAIQQGDLYWTFNPENGEIDLKSNELGLNSIFEWIELPLNQFALRASNGLYLSAQNGGNAKLMANASAIGLWETFTCDSFSISQLLGNLFNFPDFPYRYIGTGIGPGFSLIPGDYLRSPRGNYSLVYQPDGDLTLFEHATAIWSSNTRGQIPGRVSLEHSGNLIMYSNDNLPIWSVVANASLSSLELLDDGNLVLFDQQKTPLWATATTNGFKVKESLSPGEALFPGQNLMSNNRLFRLDFQLDGNLILSRTDSQLKIWSTGITTNIPGRVEMQKDGNLQVFNAEGFPVWSTFLSGNEVAADQLILQNDGMLSFYQKNQAPIATIFGAPTIRVTPSLLSTVKHISTSQNSYDHFTILDYPFLNDNPDALVFPARVWGNERFGTSNPNSIGVEYTGVRWAIVNQDPAKSVNPNDSFYVLSVPGRHPNAFVHRARSENSVENRTYLDHHLTNSRPNIYLLVAQRGAVYNNHELGVRYDTDRNQWYIFNKVNHAAAQADPVHQMPVNAQFNVLAIQENEIGDISVFSHQLQTENILHGSTTLLDHPDLNSHPEAMVFFTECWRQDFLTAPDALEGALSEGIAELWYDHPEDIYKVYRDNHWVLYNANGANMIRGQGFNLFVWKPLPNDQFVGFKQVVNAANSDNWTRPYTSIDHPNLNGRPNARIFINSNWGIGATGVDNDNHFRVDFHLGRWRIHHQRAAAIMNSGYVFNVLVAPDNCPNVFIHRADAGSSSMNRTYIDNPLCNGRENVYILATQRGNMVNDRAISVAYEASNGRWFICNQITHGVDDPYDTARHGIPEGAEFNVLVVDSIQFMNLRVFSHFAGEDTIIPPGQNISFIDHELLNRNPDAMFLAMPCWRPDRPGASYNNSPTALWFDDPADAWDYKEGFWSVYNSTPGLPMTPGMVFNIFVLS